MVWDDAPETALAWRSGQRSGSLVSQPTSRATSERAERRLRSWTRFTPSAPDGRNHLRHLRLDPDIATYPLEIIAVPTLVMRAPDDPLASYGDARAMAARIPRARFVTVPRGGHVFMHRDQTALAEVARFRRRPRWGSTTTTPSPQRETRGN
jgi:pimeloyl-ACP methyl ester carboxylesterase